MFILSSGTHDWIISGLTKLLPIIAVLQLVKKIPDIINSIFGTKIQTRGGIKGRLGEMAGVGGLAQKAWTALGNTGKNLAKLGLTAPVAGGYALANGLYHKKTGKWLKDNTAFQTAKGALYGARQGIKTGSWMSGYQEYEKESTPPTHSRAQLIGTEQRINNQLSAAGLTTKQGTWSPELRDGSGNLVYGADGKQKFKTVDQIKNEISTAQGMYKQAFRDSKLGRQLATSMDAGVDAQIKYNSLMAVQTSGEKVAGFANNVFSTLNGNPSVYTAGEINQAREIASRLASGNRLVTSDDAKFLVRYMDSETATQFTTATKKYDDALQTAVRDTEYKPLDLIAVGSLGGAINNAKAAVDDADREQQNIVAQMSDIDKVAYQTYMNPLKQMTSSLSISNQFNTAAPTDLVVDEGGNQVQGWANDTDLATGDTVGTGIKDGTIVGGDSFNASSAGSSSNSTFEVVSTVAGRKSANSQTPALTDFEKLDQEEAKLMRELQQNKNNPEAVKEINRELQRTAAKRQALNGRSEDE